MGGVPMNVRLVHFHYYFTMTGKVRDLLWVRVSYGIDSRGFVH